jgi:TIR domain
MSASRDQEAKRWQGLAEAKRRPAILEAKADRARDRGYIQLFLSHKQKDYESAEQIRNVLSMLSDGLRVLLSENIAKGLDWQQEIQSQIIESDWFVLLFTGDDDDWSWSLYETGNFRAMYSDTGRVVVLYPPNVTLPYPLQQYQAVKCQSPEDLYRFFEDLFGKEPGIPSAQPVLCESGRRGSARCRGKDRQSGWPSTERDDHPG